MAKILRPRRGKKSSAESQSIVLESGEVFFEYPDDGVGTGSGKVKMGDGETEYSKLPYFMGDDTASALTTDTTITDSTNAPLVSLKVKGKTEQFTTSGKNLLDTSRLVEAENNGVVYTPVYKDGLLQYINCNGTNTSAESLFSLYSQANSIPDELKKGVEYIASVNSTGNVNIQIYEYINNAWSKILATNTSKSFVISENATGLLVRLQVITKETSVSNVKCYPMIRLATVTDDTYEPYTGGIASPNPDYPQEINGLAKDGSIEVKTCGKNLINYDEWKKVKCARGTAVWENNGVTITSTGADAYLQYYHEDFPEKAKIDVVEGEQYTLSWEESSDAYATIHVFGQDNKSIVYTKNHEAKKITFTIPSGITQISYRFGVQDSGVTISYKNIQIEKGDTATDYEPYTETTATIPTDALLYEGDYIEMYADGSGRLVRAMAEVVLDGSNDENWFYISPNLYVAIVLSPAPKDSSVNLYSNYYLRQEKFDVNNIMENALQTNKSGALIIGERRFTTLTDWKSWLQSNPVTVVYELAEPTETPLTAEQVAEFKKLYTFEPVTNVLCDGEVEILYHKNTSSGVAMATVHKKSDSSTYDGDGNVITDTYSTKTELTNVINGTTAVTKATSATYATTATKAGTSTYATNSGTASYSSNSAKATSATSATYASTATKAGSASYATNSGTASYSSNGAKATSATSATYASTSTKAGTATYSTNSGTASYSSNGAKATSATSATYATTATKAGTATYATNSGTATYSSNGAKATSATSATYATTATNAGTATYAPNSGTAACLGVNNTESKSLGRLQFFQKSGSTALNPDSGWWSLLRTQHPGYADGYWQEMAYSFNSDTIKFRRNVNGTTSAWKTLAFTDSNISGTAAKATSATSATYASTSTKAGTSTYATNSGTASYSSNGAKATSATSATYASTANYAKSAPTYKGATTAASGTAGLVPAATTATRTAFLRGDGAWATPTNTTYSSATTASAGLMSASDKSKLDGITASADSVSVSQSLTSGTQVGTITVNGTATKLYAPTNTDTHYTTRLKVGASSTATANAVATNGNVYLNVLDNTTVRDSHKIVGSGATTVTSDANGVITISSTNTNTDTKVTQTATTASANYPLLLAPASQTSTTTTSAYFDSGVTLNPNTNTIAANVSGSAAKATSATSATYASTATKAGTASYSSKAANATYDSNGAQIVNTYAKKSSVLTTLSACEASTSGTDIAGASALAELNESLKTMLLDSVYPVGSVYMSTKNTSPATFIGGTWSAISADKYLKTITSGTGGSTGGSSTSGSTTLTVNQIPSHNHAGLVYGTGGGSVGLNYAGASGSNQYSLGVGSGTAITTEYTGGGQGHTHTITPPYYSVYAWVRTA